MNAKEMFEKLGYKLEYDYEEIKKYKKTIRNGHKIDFIKYIAFYKSKVFCYTESKNKIDYYAEGFDIQELQAINKQVEELGWLGNKE